LSVRTGGIEKKSAARHIASPDEPRVEERTLLKRLKQAIDRAAINAASKSLPKGAPNAAKVAKAMELLRRADLLEPPSRPAQLKRSSDGAFQFESAFESGLEMNDLARGRLFLRGEDWATRPLIILVHGWNAELHYLFILPLVARALNKRGFNAALLELPFHLHRRPGPGAAMRDFISDDLPGMIDATRQAISDIDSLARWAKSQGCSKVAVWGFSLGAWLAGLYVCHSALCSAAVLTTPISNLATAVRDLEFCHPIRACLAGDELDLTRLNLTQHRPLISPQAIQVMQSEYDLFAPAKEYDDLARAWGLNDWVKEPQGHISVLASRSAMKRSIKWLAQQLLETR
jgi:pimeloyl-ACP methyl ester carboxylesterase